MARNRSGARSGPKHRSKSATVPQRSNAQPSVVTTPSAAGGIASTIAEGMAFGTGSAIAHRAAAAVLGPRVVQHEEHASAEKSSAPVYTAESCRESAKSFMTCLGDYDSDISKCQFYADMLAECRKAGISS